jgi:hypothetical protein
MSHSRPNFKIRGLQTRRQPTRQAAHSATARGKSTGASPAVLMPPGSRTGAERAGAPRPPHGASPPPSPGSAVQPMQGGSLPNRTNAAQEMRRGGSRREPALSPGPGGRCHLPRPCFFWRPAPRMPRTCGECPGRASDGNGLTPRRRAEEATVSRLCRVSIPCRQPWMKAVGHGRRRTRLQEGWLRTYLQGGAPCLQCDRT